MITLRVPILTRRIFTLIWKRDERVAQKHVLGIFFFIPYVISKIRTANLTCVCPRIVVT